MTRPASTDVVPRVKFKSFLMERRLTQGEVSAATGIHPSKISGYITGIHNLRLAEKKVIAKALRAKPEDVFTDEHG